MIYLVFQELLALGERIGNVSTGLSEEKILKGLKQRKYYSITLVSQLEREPCCVCQVLIHFPCIDYFSQECFLGGFGTCGKKEKGQEITSKEILKKLVIFPWLFGLKNIAVLCLVVNGKMKEYNTGGSKKKKKSIIP